MTTAFALVAAAGCQANKKLVTSFSNDLATTPTLDDSFLKITNPLDCQESCVPESSFELDSISPNALADYKSISYSPITLSDCIERALQDSEVFRELGGALVNQPSNVETSLDPALTYLDPQLGEQAALSAFDANIAANFYLEKNDRPFNNQFSGSTEGILVQDLGEYELEISKLAATGTLFTARQSIIYDNNNQAGNRFEGSFWEAIIDAGFRHPLLQGSGSMFNRIAGPSRIPGQYNGVLIARTNTEISLAEFEQSTREFIANVENAYWDLYYAYRELDAQTDARDAAYEVFKRTDAQAGTERISGLEKASAEEQYLRFEAAIIESLEGRTVDGTQANSGMSGGSFRRTVGVRVAERRLRYLIGMPITDGTLLKPEEVPSRAAVVFDWDAAVHTAVSQRPETRRQRWVLKQKELELTAARNFLLPRLDLVGNYRFRGLGKSLTGGGETLRDDIINNTQESGAFSDLAGGDYQELQFGAEFRMPVGYRQANAAVRGAELGVQRARKVLEEQERKILLDLSNAIAETRRAFSAMDVAERRFNAAVEYRKQAAARIDSGRSQMDVLLEAQRRILEAQLQFINAEVEYTQAIKNVHFEKASYLRYHGILLQESQSDPQAYEDASTRYSKRARVMNYIIRDATISNPSIVQAEISAGELAPGSDSAEVNVIDSALQFDPVPDVSQPFGFDPEQPFGPNAPPEVIEALKAPSASANPANPTEEMDEISEPTTASRELKPPTTKPPIVQIGTDSDDPEDSADQLDEAPPRITQLPRIVTGNLVTPEAFKATSLPPVVSVDAGRPSPNVMEGNANSKAPATESVEPAERVGDKASLKESEPAASPQAQKQSTLIPNEAKALPRIVPASGVQQDQGAVVHPEQLQESTSAAEPQNPPVSSRRKR